MHGVYQTKCSSAGAAPNLGLLQHIVYTGHKMSITLSDTLNKRAHCLTLNLTQNRSPKEGHHGVRHANKKKIDRNNAKLAE